MARKKVDCFYCQVETGSWDMDHFPIPKAAGGTQIVPACSICHHLKDRRLLDTWPTAFLVRGLTELVDLGLKDACKASDIHESVIEVWEDISWEARLLYAKLRYAREQELAFMRKG